MVPSSCVKKRLRRCGRNGPTGNHIPERLWASGTEVAYSNYGVALAGYIVERVSGEPFAEYVENHIFAPLDTDSTTFKEPLSRSLSPRMAKGYELENGRLVAQPFELASSIMPAGAATSTAVAMARFMMMMLNDGPIRRSLVRTARGRHNDGEVLVDQSLDIAAQDLAAANYVVAPAMLGA